MLRLAVTSRFSLVAALALAGAACSDPASPGMQTPMGGTGPVAGSGGSSAGTGGGGAGGSAAGAGGSAAGSGGAVAGSAGMGGGGGNGGMAENFNPKLLSESGLFSDIKTKTLAPGVFKFTPTYALWSDGAMKQRYVYLPPGAKITTDGNLDGMEFWEYPVGFRLWKDFTRDGKLIETRLLLKKGGLTDWTMVAFRWKDDYSDADAIPLGEMNAMGTQHDVPPEEACKGCHGKMYDNAIGFSGLMLSHPLAGNDPLEVNLEKIDQMGWLTKSPPAGGFTLPGTEAQKQGFGYLHANCGMCHNVHSGVYTTKVGMDLWTHLDASMSDVTKLRAYLSTVCDQWPAGPNPIAPIAMCEAGHATGTKMDTEISKTLRFAPNDELNSGIYDLMSLRGTGMADMMKQMPPIGTELPDTNGGMAEIKALIHGLP